jgi:hypothetical protein
MTQNERRHQREGRFLLVFFPLAWAALYAVTLFLHL